MILSLLISIIFYFKEVAVPDVPEDDEELSDASVDEPLPGYEVPRGPCVPTFVDKTM